MSTRREPNVSAAVRLRVHDAVRRLGRTRKPPTAVRRSPPIHEMAHAATQLLLQRIRAGRAAPAIPELSFELVRRDSTAPPWRG